MNEWFTSDLHFWHKNVIRYCTRPYEDEKDSTGKVIKEDVEVMNEALIRNWNELVKPDDTVWVLGDLSLAFRPIELYSRRLNGKKKLVPGNHDWCHPAHKKSRGAEKCKTWYDKYTEYGWEVLPIYVELDLPGAAKVNICHMPYKGDSTDDRYQNYRLIDDGRVLLCGHVHQHWQTKRTPKGTLMINVGVDVWDQKPVSMEKLKELILNSTLDK